MIRTTGIYDSSESVNLAYRDRENSGGDVAPFPFSLFDQLMVEEDDFRRQALADISERVNSMAFDERRISLPHLVRLACQSPFSDIREGAHLLLRRFKVWCAMAVLCFMLTEYRRRAS
jgi:hypothetical protein